MTIRKYLIYIVLLSIGTLLFSCKDSWEQHIEAVDIDNTTDLSQKLGAQTNLSVFNSYVKTTGFDEVLAGSQSYTVWAPTNEALAGLDPDIIADEVKLRDFVANHIALSTYPVTKTSDTLRVRLLNNKYVNLFADQFEEAKITGQSSFVKNGVLHSIDQAMVAKASVWEYMLNSQDTPLQRDFIKGLSISVIDTVNAAVIGYNLNGNPIFAPNPPTIARNTYWVNVADLRDESKEFTFFMLEDNAFISESARLESYYPSIDPNMNSSFYLVKDLTVSGIYTKEKLPDTLLSVKGVKVPMNKGNVISSYKASNGIVHVLSALPFRLKDKVPGFKIEGEKPTGFSSNKTILYRTKLDDLGMPFSDIEVYDHKYAEYGVFYTKTKVPVVKYNVFARVISGLPGDPQVANFTQRYFFYETGTLAYKLFYTHAVTPLTYTETACGEYTPSEFGSLQFRLTAANSTSVNANTVMLDYLRFEPVLP